MSERQYEIYSFLVNYIKENLYPPTLQEIAIGVGLKSKSAVSMQLLALRKLGYIEVKTDIPRAIKLIGYKLVRG